MLDKYTYRVTWSAEDEEFVGLCAEFPSLSWVTKSQQEAFQGIRSLVEDVVNDMKKNGEVIPEAIATRDFSGKFMVRVPPELHRELVLEALEAQVSLNRYVSAKLFRRANFSVVRDISIQPQDTKSPRKPVIAAASRKRGRKQSDTAPKKTPITK